MSGASPRDESSQEAKSAAARPCPLAVVTGGNSGVGKETVRQLANRGWTVVMVCRHEQRGREAMAEIRNAAPTADLRLELCDLASLAEVRGLARRLADLPRIDALANNAGLFRTKLERTPDGFELTLGVNHLSHFLLTLLLEGKLRASRARIVNVSSQGHRGGDLRRRPLEEIFRGVGRYKPLRAYGDSKLANVLFSRALARRWGDAGVLSFSVHPGVLSTAIWDRNPGLVMGVLRWMKRFMDPPQVGGEAVARLLTDPDVAGLNGGYFDRREPAAPSKDGQDDALADALWEASARAVGLVSG